MLGPVLEYYQDYVKTAIQDEVYKQLPTINKQTEERRTHSNVSCGENMTKRRAETGEVDLQGHSFSAQLVGYAANASNVSETSCIDGLVNM